MPTRGSLTSVRISSARSFWIWSPMRSLLEGFLAMRWGAGRAQRGKPRSTAVSWALQRARDLHDLVDFQLVADLQVVVALDRKPALEAGLHLADVFLEPLQRVELAGVDDDVV